MITRFRFALERLEGAGVSTFPKDAWVAAVSSDGAVTLLPQGIEPLNSIADENRGVVFIASGVANSSPGIDVARLDIADAPNIVNIDHYEVVESLAERPDFPRIRSIAGIEDLQTATEEVAPYVFIVGPRPPEETEDHHCPALPPRFKLRG